jgi:hypothetical protein
VVVPENETFRAYLVVRKHEDALPTK